jgi:hypothetical protein
MLAVADTRVPGAISFDPLLEVLLHLETRVNINSMQIMLVDAAVERARLRNAIDRVVARFPLLLSRPDVRRRVVVPNAWRPADLPLTEVPYAGPMDFSCPRFRHFVTGLSVRNPVRWRDAPPIAFWLIQGDAHRPRSCLLVTPSHAAADAKSDSMLMEALGRAYVGADAGRPQLVHGWTCLQHRYLHHVGGGLQDAVREFINSDISAPAHVFATTTAADDQDQALDFYSETLPPVVQHAVTSFAKRAATTVNTVFSAALARTVRRALAPRAGAGLVRLMAAVSVRRLAGQQAARHYRNYMLPCRIRVRAEDADDALLASIARQTSRWKTDAIGRDLSTVCLVSRLLRSRLTAGLVWPIIQRIQGTVAAYSNPGVVDEDFRFFGSEDFPIAGYLGFGCLVPPLRFIVYTPHINGRLQLNAVYRRGCFPDFATRVIPHLKTELLQLIDRSEAH